MLLLLLLTLHVVTVELYIFSTLRNDVLFRHTLYNEDRHPPPHPPPLLHSGISYLHDKDREAAVRLYVHTRRRRNPVRLSAVDLHARTAFYFPRTTYILSPCVRVRRQMVICHTRHVQ